MTTLATIGISDEIIAERDRQQIEHCWSAQHDDTHIRGELARAAAAYALNAACKTFVERPPPSWPWGGWWNPSTPRRDLVKAAALIVAEIERLDRSQGAERA